MSRTYVSVAVVVALSAVFQGSRRGAPSAADAVRRAARDYIDALYDVEPKLIERSVSKDLAKIGFGRGKDAPFGSPRPMTYVELHRLAGSLNKNGRIGKDAPREVKVLDVLDVTASVRVKVAWGYDYMHLAKVDGRWKIVHILWQAYPPKPSGKELFKRGMCNKCHGADGRGGSRAPNLADDTWIHSKGDLPGIRRTIVNGVSKAKMKGSYRFAMNPIGSRLKLSDAELDALAKWVEGLRDMKR